MGIDRDHWGMMLFPDYMESARTTKVMRQEAFVRAVIADEAAKAAPQQKEPTTVSYERFTDRARKVMQLANQEALRFNHEYIGTEHVALGLVREHYGVARFVLNRAGIDMRKVRLEVERLIKSGPEMALMGRLPHTPRTKQVLAYAIEESRALGHLYVGTEHILLGLLREPEGIGGQVIRGLGLSLEDARRAIKDVLGEQLNKDSEPAASEPELDEPQRAEGVPVEGGDVPAWFSRFCDCLFVGSAHPYGKTEAWQRIEAEIARRTACMEKYIYELEETLSEEWSKPNPCAPFVERIAELTAERDQALAEVEKFKTTDVGTLVADAIRADRESDERECRREIRRLRAEGGAAGATRG